MLISFPMFPAMLHRVILLLACFTVARAEPVRILPLGDSITEGGGQKNVDQSTGFDWRTDAVADRVHPNDPGAEKMAECWFQALKPLLAPKTAGSQLPADDAAALSLATRKLIYKRTGELDLGLHLFQPADLKPGESRPAILFIHGGAWSGGQPSAMAMHCVHHANQGLVTATIRYRLLGNRTAGSPADCLADATP